MGFFQSISILVTLKAYYSLRCSALWFWGFPPEPYSCASARTADFLNASPAESEYGFQWGGGSVFYSNIIQTSNKPISTFCNRTFANILNLWIKFCVHNPHSSYLASCLACLEQVSRSRKPPQRPAVPGLSLPWAGAACWRSCPPKGNSIFCNWRVSLVISVQKHDFSPNFCILSFLTY